MNKQPQKIVITNVTIEQLFAVIKIYDLTTNTWKVDS